MRQEYYETRVGWAGKHTHTIIYYLLCYQIFHLYY